MGTSGIRPSFLGLSRSLGHVPHVLLTRSPLGPKTSFDLHVLSTPPAFVLSQDQTLHRDLKARKPLRSVWRVRAGAARYRDVRSDLTGTSDPSSQSVSPNRANVLLGTTVPRPPRRHPTRSPALAFSSSLPLSRCAAPRLSEGCRHAPAMQALVPKWPPVVPILAVPASRGEGAPY